MTLDSPCIRPAEASDADGIVRVFVESAVHHASLDPDRYLVPSRAAISSRYQRGQHHGMSAAPDSVTFVAELSGRIVGFVDARLDHSTDLMHRDLLYCHIAEIAVSQEYWGQGIGQRLLRAAEAWGCGGGAE